jgi:hypothetical protein
LRVAEDQHFGWPQRLSDSRRSGRVIDSREDRQAFLPIVFIVDSSCSATPSCRAFVPTNIVA